MKTESLPLQCPYTLLIAMKLNPDGSLLCTLLKGLDVAVTAPEGHMSDTCQEP